MAEPFKNLINADVARHIGHHLHRVWPDFDRKRFERLAIKGLDELEFKARAQHLCTALEQVLPDQFPKAADLLEASLKKIPKPHPGHDPDKELGSLTTDDSGLAGWALWAFGEYVARHGLAHPQRALKALHAITQRFTAEFAIRPILVAHPELTLATLAIWQNDPSAHVRRLVSEGSRPRLPWGLRLHQLVQDPSPTLPLLLRLQDDPSEYVRRSVANHLNDIAKDHPDLVGRWLRDHLPTASPERRKLLRHASRSLIKAAHPAVMQAWGLGEPFDGQVSLKLGARSVAVGGALPIEVRLQSRASGPQTLELDYRVHHVKANGETSPKTFKGKRINLPAGSNMLWLKQHSFKPVSTRKLYAGKHCIDIQLNGQTVAQAAFTLDA